MMKYPEDTIHLLPGPVEIDETVRQEFARLPVSHRGDQFKSEFQELRAKLSNMQNCRHVEVLAGSGTLANEAIAAQLSQHAEMGLVLSNGEFGERLSAQATRFDLSFFSLSVPWGDPFDYREIEIFIEQNKEIRWMWAVHCETSTGVLNNLDSLCEICHRQNIKLCVDCISSLGTVPVNLENVYLASCSSGKAICSFPGLSMVFYNHEIELSSHLPKYLDLGFYRREMGIPFTISSNLVHALINAVETMNNNQKRIFSEMVTKSEIMREALLPSKLRIINGAEISSPSVVTIELPETTNSVEFGRLLEQKNCLINYNSGYLIHRNWIQTYMTRNTTKETILNFAELIHKQIDK